MSPTSSSSSPTCSSSKERPPSASSPIGGRRPESVRRPGPWPSSPSTAAPRSSRESGRRSRRRSCRSSKTAARIWRELGVTTIEDLKHAAEQEQLRTLSGLGAKTEERILKALAEKKQEPSDRRLLGDGLGALLAVVSVLREHPAAVKVSEAGSARRRKETFRDLDIIATAKDPAALIDYFTKLKWVIEVAAKGPTKATVLSNEGLRFDLRVVPPESYGNLLQHFTGSKDHNLALRE